jgi:crossover junction endodeoxyribonuclease RuvC
MILGIDPGKTGGVAILENDGRIVVAYTMPSMQELHTELMCYDIDMCYVEKAQSFPGQGIASAFTYGDHFGQLQGLLIALHLPYELVPPVTWSRAMLAGVAEPRSAEKKIKKDKTRNFEAARRLFPDFEALRKNKPHTGITDALLLAEWGRRKRRGVI